MENLIALALPALLTFIALRLLLKPMKWVFRAAIHGLAGFLCLWLLNTVSAFTGIAFPMNAATVLIAGFLGLPGIGLLAVLAVI